MNIERDFQIGKSIVIGGQTFAFWIIIISDNFISKSIIVLTMYVIICLNTFYHVFHCRYIIRR